MKLAILAMSAVALSALTFAGVGGIQPANGLYEFVRSDGVTVGTGRFSTGGTMTLNPGPSGQSWQRDAPPSGDGQYKKVPPDQRSICIHLVDGTFTYQYKLDGEVLSTGTLVN